MNLLLLTEIDYTQLGAWGPYVLFLVTASVIVASIYTIATKGWTPFKDKWITPFAARRRKFDRMFGVCESLEASVKNIETQIRPNGMPLTDKVDLIHRKVEHIQANQRYRDDMNNAATFELDARGNMTYANGKLCDILHADEKELMFRDWVSRARAGDKQMLLRELQDAIENKMPIDVPVTFNTGTGYVQLRLKARPFVRSGSELIGFFGTAEVIDAS